MITRDQAHDLAQARLSAGFDEPQEISLYEFDLGWVAWRTPEPVAPGSPPTSTGGPQIVVDRETGDISRWPSISPSAIAEQYTAAHAEADRFPPDVHLILAKAGWHPGRNVSDTIDAWLERHAKFLREFPISDAARAALDEFGGLIVSSLVDRHRALFYPAAERLATMRASGFAEEYEDEATYAGPGFPLAFHENGPSELVMDRLGRVFLLHWAEDFFLGHSIDEALITLCRVVNLPPATDGFAVSRRDLA
ncbi:SUKH-3 domain-containing protein [Actinoplanes sp. RD1]|uniref:SUKH-3 domain-containing protein n=1 Tax=Actinoplanes sp. RD1 TaxID=3064538 RepID=UPI0027429300|nr:SUKH-3 domain-containing protein [Actinoplanes sp. RD1]